MSDENQIKLQMRQILASYDGRLPEGELAALLRQTKSGELHVAVRALVDALAHHQVAVTPGSRRVLVELLGHFGEPADSAEVLPAAEGAEDIGVREFAQRTRAVVERLAPRLKPEWSRSISKSDQAGEWGYAVTELAAALAIEQIEVTAVDRDELRTLVASLPASTEDVERLVIAEDREV